MGQGTTRVVEDNGTSGRVRALGDEITDVRRRIDALVMELDRRRHNMTNWRHHVRRHGGAVALGALVIAVSVTAPVFVARLRSRRRADTLVSRGAQFTEKARRLGQALERIADDPDRLAPRAAAGIGSRTVVAVATMIAQVLAQSAMRAMVKQRAR